MRAKKVDGNQARLVKQMRCVPGLTVAHIHTVGNGVPDLIIGYRNLNYLLEVKDPSNIPSKRRLTEDEKVFHENWTGSIHIVETIDDVLKIIN